MKNNKKWIIIFLIPATLVFLLVFALSIVMLLGTSFTNWSIGSKMNFIGIKNYIELFNSKAFQESTVNTLIWVVLQSTVHVLIGVIFALILSQKKWYFKIARSIFMLPNVISSAALGMLFLCVFNPQFGMVNNFVQMLGYKDFARNWFMDPKYSFFTVTITWLPFAAFVTLLVLAQITSIDESIFEASKIDGASEFQVNWYLVLPLTRGAIGTATILAATSMMQKIDIIMMTTSGGPGNRTLNLPMYIYNTALIDNNFSLANAAGVVLIIIGLISIGFIMKIFRMNEVD